MSNSNYAAAMFDLDGTLLDTIEDLAAAMNAAMTRCGLPAVEDVNKHFYFVGDGVDNYILRAMPEECRGDEALRGRIRAIYNELYAEGWRNSSKPYDGIPEMLAGLAERGLRLCVLSNKPDGFTREMVAHFLGEVPFEIVRGALPEVPLKPDSAAPLGLAEAMGLSGKDYIYLGDTATDMKTAVGAGMHAVGCLWGFRQREELLGAGAADLIAHPAEFLDLI